MDDQWNEKLRCPACRKTGIVSLTQAENEDIPTVSKMAEGFEVVPTEHGPLFRCKACDMEADP
jgi:hypothetical protein